jgi:hypothetical protein
MAMDGINFQVVAGILSTIIFTLSNFPMLIKAAKTRDLKSYSGINLALGNVGNIIHWVYIFYLPFGPIWFLHGFYTISAVLMLLWYFRYEGSTLASIWHGWRLAGKIGRSMLGRLRLPTSRGDKRLSIDDRNCCPAIAC